MEKMLYMNFHKKDPSEKIKEATLNLLAVEGYDAISMRKIAKEANVALGQLTYYYKTKNNLITSVVKEVLDVFYSEFENKVNNSKNKIEEITSSIEMIISEETKTEKLLITIISQSQVNKKLQKILREFWIKIIDLISRCYIEEIKDISDEQANLKARLLIGTAMENIVEKMLGVEYGINDNIILVRESAKKLGECK
jgi:AcrR family transcriptional regulator